jgi:uncharacterized protein YraI
MHELRTSIVAAFATAALFLAPSLAQAAQGVIVQNTALHAGPDDQFPPVDEVQAGTNVDVNGCLTGFTWCDISFQQDRGWVTGQDLEILFQSRRVRVTEATPDVLPFVAFEFDSYWQQNYASRPFYRDRDRYASITINITGGKTGSGGGGDANGGATAGKAAGAPADQTKKVVDTGACKAGDKNCPKAQGAAVDQTKKAAAVDQTKKVVDTGTCKAGDKNCPKGQAAAVDQTKKAAAVDQTKKVVDTGACKAGDKNCPKVQGAAADQTKKVGPAIADTKGCKAGDKNCPKAPAAGNGG